MRLELPMVLTFAMVQRRRQEQDRPTVPAVVFLLGYALIGTAYAAVVLAERVLPGGGAVSRIVGALLLVTGIVVLVRG